jgi:hypothetical protein
MTFGYDQIRPELMYEQRDLGGEHESLRAASVSNTTDINLIDDCR